MLHADRWDSLIQYWAGALLVDWLLIKAVIAQESGFNPLAVSSCGAQGLMQLMPTTAAEMKITNTFDPDSNLRGGISYLRDEQRHFPEITDNTERWKFALAAYNAGRGNINTAIQNAKDHNLDWQKWEFISSMLHDVTGNNANETIAYVDKIIRHWQELKNEIANGGD